MDGLQIGDKVLVTALAEPQYDINQNREWIRRPIYSREGWYVGYSYKKEGRFVSEGYDPYFGNRRQGYLTDIHTVKVMRIKFSEKGNDCFALRQDIVKLKGGG